MKNRHTTKQTQALLIAFAAIVVGAAFYSARGADGDTNAPNPAPGGGAKPPSLMPDFLTRMDVFGGIMSLNPFQIVGPPFRLTNSATKVYATIQINYHDRWAWKATTDTNKISLASDDTAKETIFLWWGQDKQRLINLFDFQARAGYVFSQNATNASTIIGSGDFSGEFASGLRMFQTRNKDCGFVHSVNFPEVNGSLVTERAFADIHATITVGPSYVSSFMAKCPDGTYDRARFLLRGGFAGYALPTFSDATTLKDNGHGAPGYHQTWGWAAETEMSYPLGGGKFISAGARVYPSHYPAPWTVWVGATYSVSDIASVVQKIMP